MLRTYNVRRAKGHFQYFSNEKYYLPCQKVLLENENFYPISWLKVYFATHEN